MSLQSDLLPTRSQLVGCHTIAYIKLPTAEAYGIFIISAFSAFVFGLSLPDNLQFSGSVDPTGFASDMLNR